ncbi:MAG: right-handed parallel beta-helix repeat-containing protein [Pseudomonadota bacterium]|nr:right-handed parallel beta-helix repeat-containing protein [Pseudomonadota bacterium]
MSKFLSPLIAAGALLALPFLGAAPALAGSPVTFVSGKGADSGTCASPATPCRTFQFALDQTSPGGEIKALDPADYGPVTITNSISITGVEGASINRPSGNHITINAGPNDTINLSHLTLDGLKTAPRGIILHTGGPLTVTHCTVRNFTSIGIAVFPRGNTAFLIADTAVSDNSGASGIVVIPQGTGTAQGTLDHVSADKNDNGIFVAGPSTVLAVDSTATNNRNLGFFGSPSAVLRLSHSAAMGNGLDVIVQGRAESASNNFVRGNSTRFKAPPMSAPNENLRPSSSTVLREASHVVAHFPARRRRTGEHTTPLRSRVGFVRGASRK